MSRLLEERSMQDENAGCEASSAPDVSRTQIAGWPVP